MRDRNKRIYFFVIIFLEFAVRTYLRRESHVRLVHIRVIFTAHGSTLVGRGVAGSPRRFAVPTKNDPSLPPYPVQGSIFSWQSIDILPTGLAGDVVSSTLVHQIVAKNIHPRPVMTFRTLPTLVLLQSCGRLQLLAGRLKLLVVV